MKKMLCLQDVSGVSEVDLAERLRIITGWEAELKNVNGGLRSTGKRQY